MTWDITPASLKAVCRENNLYYHKPELNDVLYLHCKGITKLENLEAFSGLKALYLEGNAISAIENIGHMSELKCLFMSKNVLHGLEGIQRLTALVTLDVSHNDLYSLAPLAELTTLQSLNAGNNKISGAEGIAPLLECTQLKTLDLEKNRIESPEALEIIMTLPLSLLRLVGNRVVSTTKNYRKRLMIQMPTLVNLDDMPCFPKDRRLAEAFMRGGAQEESAERLRIKQEEQDAREKSRQAFNDMVALAKQEAAERAIEQAALAEAAAAVATDLVGSVMNSALTSASETVQHEQEKAEIQQAASQLVQAVMQSVIASEQQSKSALTQDTDMEAESSGDMLVDDRDYSMSSVSDAGLNSLNAQNSELEKKIQEMHVSLGGSNIQDALIENLITSSGPVSNQGLLADIKSAGRGDDCTNAEGSTTKSVAKAAVWNTSRYRELWDLALKAGNEQDQVQLQVAADMPEGQGDCSVTTSNHHDLNDMSIDGEVQGDHVDAVPGGLGALEGGVDIEFPLGSGLPMLRSYPVAQGSSSDGSDTKIGAHCLSVEDAAKLQSITL